MGEAISGMWGGCQSPWPEMLSLMLEKKSV